MQRVNEYDRDGDCYAYGKKVEERLISVFNAKGYETRASTLNEDKYQHADFFFKGKNGKWYSVDVKGMKRKNRSDSERQDVWTFVEFQNTAGYPGWTVKGAYLIAFERERDFVLIRRTDLKRFCDERVDRSTRASSAGDAKYICYSRSNRKDLISMIKIDDLPEDQVRLWSDKGAESDPAITHVP